MAGGARREHDEEAFAGELLRHGPADAPAHAHRQVPVVDGPAMRQPRIAPVRLPLGRGPDHHRDRLPPRVDHLMPRLVPSPCPTRYRRRTPAAPVRRAGARTTRLAAGTPAPTFPDTSAGN